METPQLVPSSMLCDSALLSTFDNVEAALSTLGAYRLELLADLDQRGLATEHGARDTIEFLSLRHHRNRRELRRDLKTANALPKYCAVTAALPNPTRPDDHAPGLNPGQAEAIITTLQKAPPTVPDEVLRTAEEQMIEAARLLTPDGLLDFGRQVLDRLDTDGPEPAEDDAYAKESLTLRRADGGVKFNGYLAGENAEKLQVQINRLSKPHRTIDGELDPRPHSKRQADAFTTILDTAAANTPPTNHNPGTTYAPQPGGTSPAAGPETQGVAAGSGTADTAAGSGTPGTGAGVGTPGTAAGLGTPGSAAGTGTAAGADEQVMAGAPDTAAGSGTAGTGAGLGAAGSAAGSGTPGTADGSGTADTAAGLATPGAAAGSGAAGGVAGSDGQVVLGGPGGQGGSGPGVPHITVTIDLDDLRNATSQAVGELVYGDNLSAGAVRRLACDAAIVPIVLGSDSQPLDVGTEQRFVTRHIRRALVKRDKGCVICKAPPWQCHAHHLIHWVDGGPTAITNLVLLCAGHHRAVHSGHWTITITNGVVEVARPSWTTPTPTSPTNLAALTDLSRYFTPPAPGQPTAGLSWLIPGAAAVVDPWGDSSASTGGSSGLTPEAAAVVDPWSESGTPSAGP